MNEPFAVSLCIHLYLDMHGLILKQAYDYWQDQPDYYLAELQPSPEGQGGIQKLVLSHKWSLSTGNIDISCCRAHRYRIVFEIG